MADILVRHCVFRVVRHGGWSWGGDRAALVERMTQLIPNLIAERLAGLFTGDESRDISGPLRIRLNLRLADLQSDELCIPLIEEQMQRYLRRDNPELATQPERHGTDDADGPGLPDAETADQAFHSTTTPLELLLRFREHEDLWMWLSGFSELALDIWYEALLRDFAGPGADADQFERIRELVETAAEKVFAAQGTERLCRITRLYLATELVARFKDSVSASQIRNLLDELFEVLPAEPAAPTLADEISADAIQLIDPATQDTAGIAMPRSGMDSVRAEHPDELAKFDGSLSSVLPWLVLGELQRIGYLNVVAAALQARGDEGFAASFATALALKTLSPPKRGWHQSPSARRTAATFAGTRAPIPLEKLRLLDSCAYDILSPATSHLASELVKGHDPLRPWFVTRVRSGVGDWLLLDADGVFPVCITPDVGELAEAVRNATNAMIWLSPAAAEREMTLALEETGRRFVTTARPARGDDWVQLAHGIWSNDRDLPARPYRRAAAEFDDLDELVNRFSNDFLLKRPLFGRGKSRWLDRITAQAAAVGLGSIAWTLWRERETVDPSLALERFGDLTGDARVTDNSLQIRVAVGARYIDLKKHGFLRDIPRVPWLNGRSISFPGP